VNPFDLRGPDFLLFYAGLSVLTLLVLWALDQTRRIGPTRSGLLRDPYLIAGLRGGESEVVRLAVLALLERRLVVHAGKDMVERAGLAADGTVTQDPAAGVALPPMERAVYQALGTGRTAVRVLVASAPLLATAKSLLEPLEAQGLMVTQAHRARRRKAAHWALGLLLGVATIKIIVAVSRGRSNLLFLVVLAALACWAVFKWSERRALSSTGRSLLDDLRGLFGTRRVRWRSTSTGTDTPDVMLAAAVGGIVGGPFTATWISRRTGESGGSGCGMGSGCGGGCGGGGCGGCGG
jgi:uncharacterized protein (TIGR04222 family)